MRNKTQDGCDTRIHRHSRLLIRAVAVTVWLWLVPVIYVPSASGLQHTNISAQTTSVTAAALRHARQETESFKINQQMTVDCDRSVTLQPHGGNGTFTPVSDEGAKTGVPMSVL